MDTPWYVIRHGHAVWETLFDMYRGNECMCFHCKNFKPNTPLEHCTIAADLYEICKEEGNAFIMTRCVRWMPIPTAPYHQHEEPTHG